MGPEARVVVDGVVGEMGGDKLGVACIERFVVGADVVEVGQRSPRGWGPVRSLRWDRATPCGAVRSAARGGLDKVAEVVLGFTRFFQPGGSMGFKSG